MQQCLRHYRWEKPIKVRLLFEPKLAVYITERQWHATQEFRKCQDGRVEMRMETTGRKELVVAIPGQIRIKGNFSQQRNFKIKIPGRKERFHFPALGAIVSAIFSI